ncbi:hypothetical protein GOV13_01630 [Candidatus Pacearchaeota archaeon]|nr:hypothetical protein [Candidatus Pacearchaeota archaeon]
MGIDFLEVMRMAGEIRYNPETCGGCKTIHNLSDSPVYQVFFEQLPELPLDVQRERAEGLERDYCSKCTLVKSS